MTHRLTTDLTLSHGGYETTFPAVVEYWHHKAFNGGRSEPSTPEHVEIGCVYIDRGKGHRDPLPEWMIEALKGARTWFDLVCAVAEIDPEDTWATVKAVGPDGERVLAKKSLQETLNQIDAALTSATREGE